MFKDIITKEQTNEQCPYCESYTIIAGKRKPALDGRWIQPMKCERCGNPWTRVYNENQNLAYIVLDDITQKNNKSMNA